MKRNRRNRALYRERRWLPPSFVFGSGLEKGLTAEVKHAYWSFLYSGRGWDSFWTHYPLHPPCHRFFHHLFISTLQHQAELCGGATATCSRTTHDNPPAPPSEPLLRHSVSTSVSDLETTYSSHHSSLSLSLSQCVCFWVKLLTPVKWIYQHVCKRRHFCPLYELKIDTHICETFTHTHTQIIFIQTYSSPSPSVIVV